MTQLDLIAKSIQEIHFEAEDHEFLREYKRRRFVQPRSLVQFLYDISALQASLICLSRFEEVIRLAQLVRPHVPDGESTSDRLAKEIFGEEIVSLGAYAARVTRREDAAAEMLGYWGNKAFGWRSRTRPHEMSSYYEIMCSSKDVVLVGLDGLVGEDASERLFTLCRALLLVLTDYVILGSPQQQLHTESRT